ncbi:MAG: hypothetical protein ACJAWL_001330 [Motiliproteus sp.]|jgi:hypothetical protein
MLDLTPWFPKPLIGAESCEASVFTAPNTAKADEFGESIVAAAFDIEPVVSIAETISSIV